MKRYIIRPRSPGQAAAAEAAVQAVTTQFADSGAEIVKADLATGQHVVRLAENDAAALAASRPDLIVEEDQPIDLFRVPGLPEIVPLADQVEWQITVRAPDNSPLADCTVFAVGPQVGFRADTGADGIARLMVPASLVQRVIASPRAGFWSRVVPPPTDGTAFDIVLKPLDPAVAAGWWHRLLGLGAPRQPSGRGVSVCVIDSGIHPGAQIEVASGINTLDGGAAGDWNVDEKGHGTHVAGIIGARPSGAMRFAGVAPGVTLHSAKVFPGGFVSDIVEALDWARAQQMDLVNMSLGARAPSQAMASAIAQAVDAGVTVVAATGNDAASVAWPAAFPDAIAVGAIGRLGSFPSDSGHSLKAGPHRDWWGGLFSASFTNFGPEVDVCAPGVAIASTVPQGFVAWDGTSMACPMVTGLLALALERAPWLRTGSRASHDMLAMLIAAASAPLGMSAAVQGAGLLTAPRLMRTLDAWENGG